MFNPTQEQIAIFEHIEHTDENLVIDAKAGTGKTSTLIRALALLRGTVSLQAFNKSIAVEVQEKAGRLLSFEQMLSISISTVHSHGLSAFRKAGMRPKTLGSKLNFMLKDQLALGYDEDDDIHRNRSKIANLASMAKNAGFGLSSDYENFPSIEDKNAWLDLAEHFNIEDELVGDTSIQTIIAEAQRLLKLSNARVNSIDFDDMIYLPLLHNLPIPLYDNILLDEAQDINATRREMAFRSMTPGGRIIAVGDPNQAIYGFTGADVASLARITSRAKAKVLPLSTCWRCDGRIIAEAQQYVPAIKCRPGAEELGQVASVNFTEDDFLSLPQPGDAILCRLNKPNVAVALGLLRRGQRPRIEGRDLGRRLLTHLQSATDLYALQPLDVSRLDLDNYLDAETDKLLAKNREAAITLLEDEVEAVQLLIDRCIELKTPSYQALEGLINSLFGDDVSSSQVITLSSVHKSKGREWKRVFILGYEDYMPFHLATAPWELEQENNLIYVAQTRAEKTLVYVNGVQSAIDRKEHRNAPKAKEEMA